MNRILQVQLVPLVGELHVSRFVKLDMSEQSMTTPETIEEAVEQERLACATMVHDARLDIEKMVRNCADIRQVESYVFNTLYQLHRKIYDGDMARSPEAEPSAPIPDHPGQKYWRQIYPVLPGTAKPIAVDVYCVLKAFTVTCPALQHALKKLLCAGQRGKGDTLADLCEALGSIQRAIELHQENNHV